MFEEAKIPPYLERMLEIQLAHELEEHLGPPPQYQHLGIIYNLEEVLSFIGLGNRLKGLHCSCVSGEYSANQETIQIACLVMGNHLTEYHLAYVGDDANDLDTLAGVLNQVLLDHGLASYDWHTTDTGRSAHLPLLIE